MHPLPEVNWGEFEVQNLTTMMLSPDSRPSRDAFCVGKLSHWEEDGFLTDNSLQFPSSFDIQPSRHSLGARFRRSMTLRHFLKKQVFPSLVTCWVGYSIVLETFSKSSSERVPSECRHCRLTSNLFTKEFFTSRQPRYIQFGGWLKISCWISF